MRTLLSRLFGRGATAVPEGEALSRRRFLLGLGAAGAVLTAGSLLAASEPALAVFSGGDGGEILPDAEGELDLAQMRRRDDDDDDDDNRGRRDDRRERREDRRGRRMSRRELRRRCERDRSFRRDNRGLCRSVSGRGRAGQCVQIGPFLVCD